MSQGGNLLLIVNFMIFIIVHLPLRGCPLKCYFFKINILSVISGTNEREDLFPMWMFLDMQIGMELLVNLLLTGPKKNRRSGK